MLHIFNWSELISCFVCDYSLKDAASVFSLPQTQSLLGWSEILPLLVSCVLFWSLDTWGNLVTWVKNICEFMLNIISRMKRRKRSGTWRELWGVSERQTHWTPPWISSAMMLLTTIHIIIFTKTNGHFPFQKLLISVLNTLITEENVKGRLYTSD